MFEARLISSGTLKKVLDSIKDLLNEATFDCSDSGIQVRSLLDVVVAIVITLGAFSSPISFKPWTTRMSPSSR